MEKGRCIYMLKGVLKKSSARWSHEATVNFLVSSIRKILYHVSGWEFYWRGLGGLLLKATAEFTRYILELFCLPFPEAPSPSLGDAL